MGHTKKLMEQLDMAGRDQYLYVFKWPKTDFQRIRRPHSTMLSCLSCSNKFKQSTRLLPIRIACFSNWDSKVHLVLNDCALDGQRDNLIWTDGPLTKGQGACAKSWYVILRSKYGWSVARCAFVDLSVHNCVRKFSCNGFEDAQLYWASLTMSLWSILRIFLSWNSGNFSLIWLIAALSIIACRSVRCCTPYKMSRK